jgi:hypothetical protein
LESKKANSSDEGPVAVGNPGRRVMVCPPVVGVPEPTVETP